MHRSGHQWSSYTRRYDMDDDRYSGHYRSVHHRSGHQGRIVVTLRDVVDMLWFYLSCRYVLKLLTQARLTRIQDYLHLVEDVRLVAILNFTAATPRNTYKHAGTSQTLQCATTLRAALATQ